MEQLQTAGLGIIIAFEALGTIFCALRVWSRLLLARGIYGGLMMWSDVLLFIAWLFSVGETLAQYELTVRSHYGYHLADVLAMDTNSPLPELIAQSVIGAKWNLANQLLYNPILAFIKASVILLYLRLGGTKRTIRLASYSLITFTFLLMVAIFLTVIFQCSPFEYNYNAYAMDLAAQQAAGANAQGMKNGVYVTGGHCIAQTDFYLISSGFTILTDLLVLAIPIYMVWDLQMKQTRKFAVVGILSMGIAVTAVGVARLPVLNWQLSRSNPDPTYTVGQTISSIETGLALCTACIPDLLPLMNRFFPRLMGHTSHPRTSGVSRSGRKPYMPSVTGTQMSGRAVPFPMEQMDWRKDQLTTAEVHVKGGASDSSRNTSEEVIIRQSLGEKGRIVKTTHFTIEDVEDDKRWSAV